MGSTMSNFQIIQGDALTVLSGMPINSVDLIATDPPYGIGYQSGWQTMNDRSQKRAVSKSFGEDVLQTDWLLEAYRVLKPTAALYMFTRWDVLPQWIPAIEAVGFKIAQRIIWDKRGWGAGNLNYYGSQVEDILFCPMPDHRLRWHKRQGNLWSMTKLDAINNEGNYDNPTQKPESIMKRIIHLSSDEGDLVVDPFCGTGTTGAAALKLGRRCIVGDRDGYQISITRERLALPVAPRLPLFGNGYHD